MQHLLLIRGLPGSGKSTLAASIPANTNNWFHYEADMYFMKAGEYRFAPEEVKAAHEWCKEKTLRALEAGYSVVVSNTFTRLWEMDDYFRMAEDNGVMSCRVTCHGEYPNVHGVSPEVIQKMRDRWED